MYGLRSSRRTRGYIDPGPEPADLEEESSGDEMNVDPPLQEDDQPSTEEDPLKDTALNRMVIAIDFGTTFSAVAYTILPRNVQPDEIGLDRVNCIGNYPGYQAPSRIFGQRQDVPTELWYDYGQVEALRTTQHSIISNNEDESSSDDDSEAGENDVEHSEHEKIEIARGKKVIRQTHQPITQYWGYNVQEKLSKMNIPRENARPLTRFKLCLAEDIQTESVRTGVKKTLNVLKRRKIITQDTDIYLHYLTHLLRHTKQQLGQIIQKDTAIQFVLCVPAKWPTNACRIMQTALERAVMDVGFGEGAERSVHNIFIISEPEAAAQCILTEENSDIRKNETVVVMDAGGGTIDAVTYECTHGYPIRLSKEVVAPNSRLCGASYINENFQKKLLHKLSGADYLEANGVTLTSIAQEKTNEFENHQKRVVDVNDRKAHIATIFINYLREDRKKHFSKNNLELKRKTMFSFFERSMVGVRDVLRSQLEMAESKGHRVEKVVLTGGFGQSPSLQTYLRDFLKEHSASSGRDIDLVVPQNPSTAVARGAVLRALNKSHGPSRHTQCSYGFIIGEQWDPEMNDAHAIQKPHINKIDGLRYIDETIKWVINTGDAIDNMAAFTFPVIHSFPVTRERLICREALWVSDMRHQDSFRKTHARNKGAELAGKIEADLTFLLNEGRLQRQRPPPSSTHFGTMKEYWEVHYEVALIVEGRSIRFEARWPAKDKLLAGETQRTLNARLIGIASAFLPGTA